MKTILHIDRHCDYRTVVAAFLRRWGYEALEAAAAASGLELAREHRPDLIITDLGLPDLDGLDVCRHIQHDEYLSGTPVLMLSLPLEEKEMEVRAACAAHVAKGSPPADIRDAIQSIIGPASTEGE